MALGTSPTSSISIEYGRRRSTCGAARVDTARSLVYTCRRDQVKPYMVFSILHTSDGFIRKGLCACFSLLVPSALDHSSSTTLTIVPFYALLPVSSTLVFQRLFLFYFARHGLCHQELRSIMTCSSLTVTFACYLVSAQTHEGDRHLWRAIAHSLVSLLVRDATLDGSTAARWSERQ